MDKLEIVLVPCSGNLWLAFPKEIMGQVYPYAPLLTTEKPNEFLAGAMLLQNEKIPVYDFQFENQGVGYDGLFKTVIISTVKNTQFPHYAIVSYGDPIIVIIEREQIRTLNPGTHKYIAQNVAIIGHEKRKIAILDLPVFEDNLTL